MGRVHHASLGAVIALLAVLLPAIAPAEAENRRGEVLYGLCVQCHGTAGEGSRLALAPAIAGMEAWYVAEQLKKFQAGYRGGHPDDIGGLRMRPMSMWLKHDTEEETEADIQAISAFVAAMPPVEVEPELEGGSAERGQGLYAPCIACHMPNGGGMEALKAPSLTKANDWYLLTQLQNYKSGARGSVPGDANGAVMRGMAATLVDEQAMKDVIAYIRTLGK